MGDFFHLHAHSHYSSLDGMCTVTEMVETAAAMGQPGIALTDHGNLSGVVELYKAAKKNGLAPFPGEEFYLVPDKGDKDAKRYHMGILALNLDGYKALVALSSRSHFRENYHRKPRIDFDDLDMLSESNGSDVLITSGCYFGILIQTLINHGEVRAKGIVQWFAQRFPNLYIECQMHETNHVEGETDGDITSALWSLATETGVPVVITQDSHYCSDPSAPVLMADLTYKPIGEVKVGDEVLGWDKAPSGDRVRKRYVKTRVTNVLKRHATNKVRITLSDGSELVVTADHRWATWNSWRYNGSDVQYEPVKIGDKMVRVSYPVDQQGSRDMAWLGGMYDGEGSDVGITQSRIANPDVCNRIERVLEENFFDYSVNDNGSGCSVYRINGGRSEYIRFVHLSGLTRTKFFEKRVYGSAQLIGSPEVVSIDPYEDGEVVSLTTETHNYVVYGLASSNCHLDQVELHDAMKRLVIHTEDPDDAVFPGDSYHLCDQKWIKRHFAHDTTSKRVYNASMQSHREILELNQLSIPPLDNYKFRVPHVASNPQRSLNRLVRESLSNSDFATSRKYVDRLDHELRVIDKTGFADYLLFVAKVCRWARKQGILINIRGSANGSLVCYLLDITNIDPIKWGIGFDRFMTEDRTKPPDIDIDVEDARRSDIVEYLESKYNVRQIGTYNSMGLDIYGRGSWFIQHLGRKRKELGDGFRDIYGYVDSIADLPDEERDMLSRLDSIKVSKSPGAHAAGFIIEPPGLPIEDYVPTMLIPSSGNLVTQFTMSDVEALGYVKLDLLGLRTLTLLRRCLEMIGRDPLDGLGWIPENDKATFATLRKVQPDSGIFQFEGKASAWGSQKLRPRRIKDCIDAMALFRPAAMQTGQTDMYLARRLGRAPAPTYPHPAVEKALGYTNGVVLYQEQVMTLLRELGMGVVEMNRFLDAVKSSGTKLGAAHDTFDELAEEFVYLCMRAGMGEDDGVWVWDQIKGFADYGFNQAHATAYGLLGYQAAYLKTHHPLEYMTAVLETSAGTPREKLYMREARRMGIRLLPPDVNISGYVWTIDRDRRAIRKGLTTIKGVGAKAAHEIATNGPYQSIEDLIERTDSRAVTGGKKYMAEGEFNGVLEKLAVAGALKSLGVGQ